MYSEVRLEVSNSTALCDGGKKFASSAEVTVLDVSGAAVYSTSLIQAIEEGLRQNPDSENVLRWSPTLLSGACLAA